MKSEKEIYNPIGNILDYKKVKRGIFLTFDNGIGEISIFSPNLVRLRFTPKSEFGMDYSYAVIKSIDEWEKCDFQIKDEPDAITLEAGQLILKLSKDPYRLEIFSLDENAVMRVLCKEPEEGYGVCWNMEEGKENVRCYKNIRKLEHYYGFGEKTGPLDKAGESMVMLAHDMPYSKKADPLYQSHPFFIAISGGLPYAIFFDNISKTTFDMGKSESEEYFFDAAHGELNYYFIGGDSIKDILDTYTELTGRMKMPPKWALGYHQCRYSYKNEKQVRKISNKFRLNHIPCDGIWFDIHYMDGYRVFTFNKKRFPSPDGLINSLRSLGFSPLTMVDPGVKIDENYAIYKDLIENKYYCKNGSGGPAIGVVWPGLVHFPDFTREEVRNWWAGLFNFYFDLGIKGIWIDMNEPSININPFTAFRHRVKPKDIYFYDHGRNTWLDKGRNVYGLCMAYATYKGFLKNIQNRRPFILTRSGYPGVQRYAAIWTGDNWTTWGNIALASRMLQNLCLSAQSFCGEDIGGFMSITKMLFRRKKIFARWIQIGVFRPFCRVHTAIFTKSQDPFSYGNEVQKISKKYIELRYSLLPYFYHLFREYSQTGEPIMRPLFYYTLDDEMCYRPEYENQFLLGKDLLIITIFKKNCRLVKVYLPEGKWVHFWTGDEFEGKREHTINVTFEDIPIFVRKGAIIPMQPVMEYIGEKPIDPLILRIFPDIDNEDYSNSIEVYNDDGETFDYESKSAYSELPITVENSKGKIEISIAKLEGSFTPEYKQIKLELAKISEPKKILVDGKEYKYLKEQKAPYEIISFTIPFKNKDTKITINL